MAHSKLVGQWRSQFEVALLALFVFAFLLRVIGLDWGGVHADENPSAAAKVLTGSLIPDVHYYPPFFNYLIAAVYAVLYVVGRVVGWWNSTEAFRVAYFSDRATFIFAARLVSAAISATAAPLAVLLAREMKIPKWDSLLLGTVVALVSSSVFWGRIAKGDSGMGPALLLFMLAAVRFHSEPKQISKAILLGFSIALALSFKHSAIFFLAPALCILAALTAYDLGQWRPWLVSWLIAFLATLAFWIPMNIGIVLDPKGFLAAQVVQSQMSAHGGGIAVSATEWYNGMTSIPSGVPLMILFVWLLAVPAVLYIAKDRAFRVGLGIMFFSSLAAMIVIATVAGQRQPTYLWLPYSTLIATTVLIALFHFGRHGNRTFALLAVALIGLSAVAFTIRDALIIEQALASPVQRKIASELAQLPATTRILTTIDLSSAMRTSSIGDDEARARNERLASKYHVVLPKVADESLRPRAEGYTVRLFPFVIGGLEELAEGEVKVILPYAWPIQLEEWSLDYWKGLKYSVFVVEDHGYFDHTVKAYRSFFRSLRTQCKERTRIKGPKPLFDQIDTYIYECPLG
jgi:4-amino-4-deoxy-L-arabinose transferase-like glycosyltransferase